MWPFVSQGHVATVSLPSSGPDVTVQVESLSDRPRVMRVREFLSDEETDWLINTANVSMFDSLTNGNGRSDVRTSKQAWISQNYHQNTEVLQRINQKVMELAVFPWKQGVDMESQELTDATQVFSPSFLSFPLMILLLLLTRLSSTFLDRCTEVTTIFSNS